MRGPDSPTAVREPRADPWVVSKPSPFVGPERDLTRGTPRFRGCSCGRGPRMRKSTWTPRPGPGSGCRPIRRPMSFQTAPSVYRPDFVCRGVAYHTRRVGSDRRGDGDSVGSGRGRAAVGTKLTNHHPDLRAAGAFSASIRAVDRDPCGTKHPPAISRRRFFRTNRGSATFRGTYATRPLRRWKASTGNRRRSPAERWHRSGS